MPCAGDATSETTMTLGHAAGLEQLFQICEAADMNGVIPFNRHHPGSVINNWGKITEAGALTGKFAGHPLSHRPVRLC